MINTKELVNNSKIFKQAAEEEKEISKEERLAKKISSITWTAKLVAQKRAPLWIQNEEAIVSQDITDFLQNGESADGTKIRSYLETGRVSVFYGNYNPDKSLARKSYGGYLLSFERGDEGNCPFLLVMTVLANGKLSKLLSKRLGVEYISRHAAESLLNQEKSMKLELNFVDIEAFAKKVGKGEPIELAKTETVIGKCTPIEVKVVGFAKNGKAWFSRTDWYAGFEENARPVEVFDLHKIFEGQFET